MLRHGQHHQTAPWEARHRYYPTVDVLVDSPIWLSSGRSIDSILQRIDELTMADMERPEYVACAEDHNLITAEYIAADQRHRTPGDLLGDFKRGLRNHDLVLWLQMLRGESFPGVEFIADHDDIYYVTWTGGHDHPYESARIFAALRIAGRVGDLRDERQLLPASKRDWFNHVIPGDVLSDACGDPERSGRLPARIAELRAAALFYSRPRERAAFNLSPTSDMADLASLNVYQLRGLTRLQIEDRDEVATHLLWSLPGRETRYGHTLLGAALGRHPDLAENVLGRLHDDERDEIRAVIADLAVFTEAELDEAEVLVRAQVDSARIAV